MTAFILARKNYLLRKLFTVLILFTMYFSGGIVPGYLNIKSLHLMNTLWALILPGAFGAASYGMTGCWDPVVPDTQRFARDVRGTALTGSYADILAQLPASAPQAAIVLFGNAGGENAFLRELHRRLVPDQLRARAARLIRQRPVVGVVREP